MSFRRPNPLLRILAALSLLIPFLLAACQPASLADPPGFVGLPTATESTTLPPTSATAPGGFLDIVAPSENTQISGGGDLRVTLLLTNHQGQPVEGAAVDVELRLPNGDLFVADDCRTIDQGLYGCPPVTLPLRGAGGTWRVLASASWEGSQTAVVETTFQANPSISEWYLDRLGFWIEQPRIFGLGKGFYNLSETGGLHFEDWLNEDGSGFVILDNYLYISIGITFAAIEIHWQDAGYPDGEAAAIAFVENLSQQGLHHNDPDVPVTILTPEPVEFQGRSAWLVHGWGSEYYVAKPAAAYPVEWLIFTCPDSEWLWSLVLHTDDETHLSHLRSIRESFQCPASVID